MALYRSTVGPKGQITLPKDLRESLHLLEGEEVVIFQEGGNLMVAHPPSSLRGRLRNVVDYRGVEKDVERFRTAWRV